jgi:tetratricopeptide (TPR) repeat protein
MSMDQYTICPCGNGKKIKFCKCHEHLAEMEIVDRMIQGEQSVAALDRINSLLKTLPSEPWLLAMKCELLLKLQETESLEETSAKFIRLQPDNPLAKMYRSLVAIMRGNVEEAANLLVQAIAGTSENLHPLFMTVAINLIESMMQRRYFLSSLMHAEMLLGIAGEQSAEMTNEIYNSIITQQNISILQRESPPSPPEADDQPYAERYREALALLERYQVQQCRTKLDGIQREFGPQGPLLIAKLQCQLLIVDIDGATETCLRLAKTDGLLEAQKVYFQALAFELSATKSGIGVPLDLTSYEVADESIEQKLVSSTSLIPMKPESVRELLNVLTGEEVPPKSAYMLVKPVLGEEFAEYRPRQAGQWIVYYGRQTDKPPRIVMIEPTRGYQQAWTKSIVEELGLPESSRTVLQSLPNSPLLFISATVQVDKMPPNDLAPAFNASVRELDKQLFLDFPLPMLNGGTPSSCANDPVYKTELAAFLLFWQAAGTSKLSATDFADLAGKLSLEKIKLSSTEDTFDLVGGASYFWIDLEGIAPDDLLQMAQSALTRNVTSIYESMADAITATKWPEELDISADYTKLALRTRSSKSFEEAEKLLEQMYEKGKVLGVPIGNVVLERADVLQQLGRSEEAGMFLRKALTEVPRDPVLMQFVQMQMMRMQQQQAAGGGGRGADVGAALARHGSQAPTPASSGSGLWTPDQGSPESTGKPASASGSGGSGLWIPGQ